MKLFQYESSDIWNMIKFMGGGGYIKALDVTRSRGEKNFKWKASPFVSMAISGHFLKNIALELNL